MTLNLGSFCLNFLNAGFIAMYHHSQFYVELGSNPGLRACWASTVPAELHANPVLILFSHQLIAFFLRTQFSLSLNVFEKLLAIFLVNSAHFFPSCQTLMSSLMYFPAWPLGLHSSYFGPTLFFTAP